MRLPASAAPRYPGELSGGERQRVAIARALAARPDVLVCDEVTSALDVSVQGAVLELLAELRRAWRSRMLFISHDLGVVASISDRVLVLRHGRVCEEGPVRTLLEHPRHEYTQRLIAAAPRMFAGNGDFGAADARETQPVARTRSPAPGTPSGIGPSRRPPERHRVRDATRFAAEGARSR